MIAPRPIFCLYGGCPATHRVRGRLREAVVCTPHLTRAQKWAGTDATTERLDGQPAARAAEQLDLFNTALEDL